jgi:tetratricopeptide (TPR) repeat protein
VSCVRLAYLSLLEEYPDDIDAKAFYAWYLVDKSVNKFGAPHQPMRTEAQQLLTDLSAVYPWHHGLAHYVIHAWEDTLRPEQALDATRTSMHLCYRSPHMVHMIGHIYYLLGDYQNASAYFAASRHIEVCPETIWQGEELSRHLSRRVPYLPTHTCHDSDMTTASFSASDHEAKSGDTSASSRKLSEQSPHSWCFPFCNSSLHNWEMHHNIAFEIMTLSQMGQMEAVQQWSELGYAMTPWLDAMREPVAFPLAFSPMASRALARYYYHCLLAPIDAHVSASMWTSAVHMAERTVQFVESQRVWASNEKYIERYKGSLDGIVKEYVIAAAKDFTTIPLHVYAAKREYAVLMSSVFVEEEVMTKAPANKEKPSECTASSRRYIIPNYAAISRSRSSIRVDANVSQAKAAFKRLEEHVLFLNASLRDLKQGDVSYSVILRNIQALICSYEEAKGVVLLAEGSVQESVDQLKVARDLSPQNIKMSIIPYNEPVVVPRPISETLAAVYELIGELGIISWV